ncbi:hypothetical protein ACLB2K_046934 [Fragaria x ananassa]
MRHTLCSCIVNRRKKPLTLLLLELSKPLPPNSRSSRNLASLNFLPPFPARLGLNPTSCLKGRMSGCSSPSRLGLWRPQLIRWRHGRNVLTEVTKDVGKKTKKNAQEAERNEEFEKSKVSLS